MFITQCPFCESLDGANHTIALATQTRASGTRKYTQLRIEISRFGMHCVSQYTPSAVTLELHISQFFQSNHTHGYHKLAVNFSFSIRFLVHYFSELVSHMFALLAASVPNCLSPSPPVHGVILHSFSPYKFQKFPYTFWIQHFHIIRFKYAHENWKRKTKRDSLTRV